MNRFEYTEPKLISDESYIVRSYNVELYDGDQKTTTFEDGELLLTSNRLLWTGINTATNRRVCLALWLKHIIYLEEEKVSGFFSRSQNIVLHLMSISNNRHVDRPVQNSVYNFIKLAFKKKTDTALLAALNQAVAEKKWEIRKDILSQNPCIQQTSAPILNIKLRTGIVGIERSIQEKFKANDESISVAFQDLNKLMGMAKDMVNLSKNISNKIKAKQGDVTDDETVQFKSYLLSLGIENPVNRNTFQNDAEYFKELAKQISDIVIVPIDEIGGIMTLTDAYCRVNRARGLDLLSPEDFLAACLIDQFMHPVALREFDSGVKVLQLSSYQDTVIAEDTSLLLNRHKYLSSDDLAKLLGISVILAKQRLLIAEKLGKACRDESLGGLRFYQNLFLQQKT